MDSHVFISYVHDNEKEVQNLCEELTNSGVKVWLDHKDIEPGIDWQQAIRRAIHDGAFFIACFSKEYEERRNKVQTERITYMNEELTLAIDILRQRFLDQTWFIPAKLNDCNIPDFDIGRGKTLRSLQYVELHKDWNAGVKRIIDVIKPITPPLQRLVEALRSEDRAVRRAASEALLSINNIDNRILTELIEALKDEEVYVHINIIDVLGKIGKPAISALIHALSDKDELVRRNAAEALGEIGDSSAVPALIQALSDNENTVTVYAAISLGKIGDSSAGSALIKILNDKDNEIPISFAAWALKHIATPEALKAVEEYEKQMRD
jgi:hypothetical protein